MTNRNEPQADPARRAARSRRVSMADVARRAGVSSQTVSRVSNGASGVVPATRESVLVAMRELGYRPNAAARALRSGEFKTIGVILFSLSTTGNVRTLDGIVARAAERGYAITLLPARPTQHGIGGAVDKLDELAVDAVILLQEIHLVDDARLDLPPGVQVVVADSDAGDSYAVVDTDQVRGAGAAVRHLLDLGHETVWHLAGPEESFAAGRRMRTWAAELRAAGRWAPPVERGDWSSESGYRVGRQLVLQPECTAIFAANDEMALGVLRALKEGGRRVPEDVSVVGFDDIPEAADFQPPLTTVHQDFAEVGRRCVDWALRQVKDDSHDLGIELVATRLISRESTAPPPMAR